MPAAALRASLMGFVAVLGLLIAAAPASAQSRTSDDVSARSQRPRVVIQPRRTQLPPNARRECRAQLVQEARLSGTVIVPQMQCWWE